MAFYIRLVGVGVNRMHILLPAQGADVLADIVFLGPAGVVIALGPALAFMVIALDPALAFPVSPGQLPVIATTLVAVLAGIPIAEMVVPITTVVVSVPITEPVVAIPVAAALVAIPITEPVVPVPPTILPIPITEPVVPVPVAAQVLAVAG